MYISGPLSSKLAARVPRGEPSASCSGPPSEGEGQGVLIWACRRIHDTGNLHSVGTVFEVRLTVFGFVHRGVECGCCCTGVPGLRPRQRESRCVRALVVPAWEVLWGLRTRGQGKGNEKVGKRMGYQMQEAYSTSVRPSSTGSENDPPFHCSVLRCLFGLARAHTLQSVFGQRNGAAFFNANQLASFYGLLRPWFPTPKGVQDPISRPCTDIGAANQSLGFLRSCR